MSLILPYRLKRSSGGGGGGSLVHDQVFVVTGTGFGTKVSPTGPQAQDYGAAGVGNLDSVWDFVAPNYGGAVDGGDTQYWTKNVALPHSNGGTSSGVPHPNTSIAISGVASGTGGPPTTDVYVSKFLTWSGADEYSIWSLYHRVANNYVFGGGSPDDDNYKWYGISEGHNGIYDDHGANMYLCYSTAPEGMHDNTTEPLLQTMNEDLGFDGPPGTGLGIYSWDGHDPSGGNAKNFAKGWVKQDIVILYSSTAGWVREYHNNDSVWLAGQYSSVTDSLSAATHWGDSNLRTEGVGGYSRVSGSLQRRYYVDVLYQRDPNPGRFGVSNNPSWTIGDGTLIEWCPHTSWSPTSVTNRFKKGGLSSGPGYVYYQNERDGNQGPWPVTIA